MMAAYSEAAVRFLVKLTIVLVAFPVVALILNTPFYGAAILLSRRWPHPGPLMFWFQWVLFAASMVVVFGGAFYACKLMWPKSRPSK